MSPRCPLITDRYPCGNVEFEPRPAEHLIVVGVTVHAIVGIHRASTDHKSTSSIHGNVGIVVGRVGVVAGVAIRSLIGHGTTVIVHEHWPAVVAIWSLPCRVDVSIHACDAAPGIQGRGDGWRGRSSAH